MEWVIGIAAVAIVIWRLGFSGSRDGPPPPQQQPRRDERIEQRSETIDLVLPKLGELEREIAVALREGNDPNKVLAIPHHAHHLSVVGESFDNNNGTSRQEIIAASTPGTTVFLVPEPDNPHDPDAVRVFVSEGGMATAQIGYLPRGDSDLVDEIRRGHVIACWHRRGSAPAYGAPFFSLSGRSLGENGLRVATI